MEATRFEVYAAGETKEELKAALVAAGEALAANASAGIGGIGDDSGTWAITEVPYSPKMDPNTLYVVGSDAEGTVVLRGTRSTSDAHADEHIMSAALELSQAVALRGVTFPERQLGGLLVRPATNPWQPITDDMPKGKYLVTVETVFGYCVEILEFNGRGWLHDGEYTFEHSYLFRPVLYQAAPAPGVIPEIAED